MRLLKKLQLYAIAASYIPPRALILYARRSIRARRVRQSFERMRQPMHDASISAILAGIATPEFLAGARRQLELTKSMYDFDLAGPTLIFLKSGDVVDLNGVSELPWRQRDAIPASDVNRAFFTSFIEQAPLATDRDPELGLVHLANVVSQLSESARPTASYLTIPWQPLPAARRMVNLLIGLAFALEQDPALRSHPAVSIILDEIGVCAKVVDLLREDDLGYNHLATAIFGQCFYAAAIGDKVLLAQRSGEFVRAMRQQVGMDGFQLERSCTYQAHMLGHLDVLVAAKMVSPADEGQAKELAFAMRNALKLMTHPDGGFAIFNDSADGDGPSSESLLALPDEESVGVYRLSEAGFVRLDDGQATVIFDVGKCAPDDTPGHAHADFLSVEISLGGERLIVDPGVSTYKAGSERDWTRSSHSHNGLTFAGLEPMEFFGAFRVARRGKAMEMSTTIQTPLSAAGKQDGFKRFGIMVGRNVALWPGRGVIMIDTWDGKATPPAKIRLIIPNKWAPEGLDPRRFILRSHNHTVRLRVVNAQISLSPGAYYQYGPRLKIEASNLNITADPTLGGNIRYIATILEWSDESIPITDAQIADIAQKLWFGLR